MTPGLPSSASRPAGLPPLLVARRQSAVAGANSHDRAHADLPGLVSQAVAASAAVLLASTLIAAAFDRHPARASRHECGTDPQDFLREGEVLEGGSLRFIVHAHCANVRYLSDERIALPYLGGHVDVEARKLHIGGETYYEILSVGRGAPAELAAPASARDSARERQR